MKILHYITEIRSKTPPQHNKQYRMNSNVTRVGQPRRSNLQIKLTNPSPPPHATPETRPTPQLPPLTPSFSHTPLLRTLTSASPSSNGSKTLVSQFRSLALPSPEMHRSRTSDNGAGMIARTPTSQTKQYNPRRVVLTKSTRG